MRLKQSALGSALLLTLAFDGIAAEVDPRLEAQLRQQPELQAVPVIIEMAERASLDGLNALAGAARRSELIHRLQTTARRSQREVKTLLAPQGGTELWNINALAATVSPALIRRLAQRVDIARIRLDDQLTLTAETVEGTAEPGWNLSAIGADRLWASGYDGAGVSVAAIDTGADPYHPDIGPRWRGGSNGWFDPYGQHTLPYDASGHGTQVLGLLLGGSSSGGPIGVAPGATWIAARAFDDSGRGTLSGIHLAFQWVLDPDGDPGSDDAPDVVVSAWALLESVGSCEREFEPDVELLRLSEIALAFSAGNSGPGSATSMSPGNYTASFAAGAVDGTHTIADFSGRGPSACDGGLYPQVATPGVAMRTADLTFGGLFPDSYVSVTGTSYAAAHLAGALALLRGAYPAASVGELEAALRNTATDLGATGPDYAYGSGLIDIEAAHAWLASTAVPDADGDGYAADGDCNDADPSVHPDAAEVRNDGIDQDCNGYDLTIDIGEASYRVRLDMLLVRATSALGADAQLQVEGYGPMSWQSRYSRWELRLRRAGGNPGTVTVRGVEGSLSAPVALQ